MNPDLIAEIRGALNILGNWHIGPPGGRTGFGKHLRYIYADGISIRISGDNSNVVAESVLTLRNHAPALLDEIERLRAENALQHSQLLEQAINVLPDRDATIERLRARVAELEAAPNTCRWREDEHGYYHTACGHLWQFTEGGVEDNNAKYCQYCGGLIVEDAQ